MTYSGSTRIRELAASLPLERIVLETDAPDIPPAWGAGQRNPPANLRRFAEVLADLRGMDVGALIAASIIAAGLTALFGEFDSSAGEVARDLNDFPIARLLFALAVGFGAPIVEELCYRGLLMTSLLKRGMSRWLSVIVSAALFAAMHLEPVRFALLFAIGLILGWARVHRNNTTTSIVAHMTNNMPGAIGILFLL